MLTVKGKICLVCNHDHWCYEEDDKYNTGLYTCCPCDKAGDSPDQDSMTMIAMHEPKYADTD